MQVSVMQIKGRMKYFLILSGNKHSKDCGRSAGVVLIPSQPLCLGSWGARAAAYLIRKF